jgi:phage gpG-like protein
VFSISSISTLSNACVKNISELPKLQSFVSESVEDALQDYGDKIVEEIRERTQSGIDIYGRPFREYSPRYRRFKGEGPVDLTVSSSMLSSLTAMRESLKLVVIRFTDTAERPAAENQKLAIIHHFGSGAIPARPFFAWRRNSRANREIIRLIHKDFIKSVATQIETFPN